MGKHKNSAQEAIFISFMEQNPDLARNFTKGDRVSMDLLWMALTKKLNSEGPPQKYSSGWKKVWSDWKVCIRKKLAHNKMERRATGGGGYNKYNLTPTEERIAAICGLCESQTKKKKISDGDKLLQMTSAKLNEGKETTEGDTISKSWGSQYDQMEVSQQIIARKIISDVLFHGCVGFLQMEHALQIQNIFSGQKVPAPNYVPQHQMMVPIHHVLKSTSNTSTPTSLRSTTLSHSAQPQSTFVAYELSEESLISSPTMSEQSIDLVEDLNLSKIKNELDIEEQ